MGVRRLLGSLLCGVLLSGAAQGADAPRLRLATTTSLDNSGLLERLLPPFEERYGVKVDVIAVGTGRALALGRAGDVDVLMVHAPEAEELFMEEGYGTNRRHFAGNDFVIVGPEGDPSGLSGQKRMGDALRALAVARNPFFSRGDDSGTHKKELSLWKGAGIAPGGPWYREVGQGMGPTLLMANEGRGYTLADRGTFLSLEEKLEIVVLYEGGRELENPYHIIAVCPQRYPHVRYVESMMLIGWVTSPEGQEIIGSLTRRGRQLFTPRLGVCPAAP